MSAGRKTAGMCAVLLRPVSGAPRQPLTRQAANVLDCLPKSVQPQARRALAEITNAENRLIGTPRWWSTDLERLTALVGWFLRGED